MGVVLKLAAKGQIALPKEVRLRHGLNIGDRAAFIEQHGKTWMKPRNQRMIDLAGVLRSPLIALDRGASRRIPSMELIS